MTELATPWPSDAIEAMHGAALALLERAGVRVESEAARELLLTAGCTGVDGGRVAIPAQVVEEALAACPRSFVLAARDPERALVIDPDPGVTYVHNLGGARDVSDPRTGAGRRATLHDQVLATRIMHNLVNQEQITSLWQPEDVPDPLEPLYSYLVLAHETDKAIEAYEEAVAIICNEEGKFNGMMPNRAIYSEPQEIEMSYGELTSRFREAERNGGEHLTGYIVFTEDSFTKPYPEAERTYAVSSNNKAFQPNMGGYSIYASALDGSDPMIRLEGYMQSEKGGKDGWKIERCYMNSDEKEMIDVIFGPFFICDCSGPNYGSLNQEQIDRFMKQFENPERLIRMNGTLMSVPYKPEPDLSR